MFITVKKIRTLAALLVCGGLTGLLVLWPRMYWPAGPPPNLLTAGGGGSLVLVVLFIVATGAAAFLLPLIVPGRRLSSILLFLTMGLVTLSVLGTGNQPATLGLTGGLLMLRAAELVLLAAILLGGVLLWQRARKQFWPAFLGSSPPTDEPAEGAAPQSEGAPRAVDRLWPPPDRVLRDGVIHFIACAAVGYVLASQFVRADGRGHAAFGTWAAFLLASLGVHQILRLGGILLLAAPPVAVGLVGYLLAGQMYGSGPVPADTRTLMVIANPCDFVGPAVAGCIMGLWSSQRIWTWRDKHARKAKAAAPGAKPAPRRKPPHAEKPAPTRRSRSRRRRR